MHLFRATVISLIALAASVRADDAKQDSPKPGVESPKGELKEAKSTPRRIAVRHIVVGHTGAERPLPDITRAKDEARKRAEEALAKVRGGENFEKAVIDFSDDPARAQNKGRLGVIVRGRLLPSFKSFEDAIFALDIDGISEILETPMGFHVVQRIEIVEFSAAHILVQYQGSDRADPSITRTKDEAEARAEENRREGESGGR